MDALAGGDVIPGDSLQPVLDWLQQHPWPPFRLGRIICRNCKATVAQSHQPWNVHNNDVVGTVARCEHCDFYYPSGWLGIVTPWTGRMYPMVDDRKDMQAHELRGGAPDPSPPETGQFPREPAGGAVRAGEPIVANHPRVAPLSPKQRIIAALDAMPDEAFGWFVLAARPSAMTQGALTQIWPDGIGGFQQASRDAITAVRTAADDYVKLQEGS